MARRLAFACFLFLLGACAFAHAVVVGDIELRSALNTPLDARIALSGVGPEGLESLSARLASAADFANAGLDRPDYLRLLRFSTATGKNGKPYIHVSSSKSIREPVLNFIVEVSWAGSKVLKEYALLIDLPSQSASSQPSVAANAAQAPAPRPSAAPARPAAVATPVRAAALDRYGPTRTNDVLHSIAMRLRPGPSVTPAQVMLAIVEKNPTAFVGGNVNRLKTEQVLLAPSLEEIQRLDASQAAQQVERQSVAWRQGLAPAAPAPARAPAAVAQNLVPKPIDASQKRALAAQVSKASAAAQDLGEQNASLRERLTGLAARISALTQKVSERDEQISALRQESQSVAPRAAATTDAKLEELMQTPAGGKQPSESPAAVGSVALEAVGAAAVAAAPVTPAPSQPIASGEAEAESAPQLVGVMPADLGLGGSETAGIRAGTEEVALQDAPDSVDAAAAEEPNLVISTPTEPGTAGDTGAKTGMTATAADTADKAEMPASAEPEPLTAAVVPGQSPGGIPGAPWMMGGIAVLAAGIVGALVFFRRRPAATSSSAESFAAPVRAPPSMRPAKTAAAVPGATAQTFSENEEAADFEPHATAVSIFDDLGGRPETDTEKPAELDVGLEDAGEYGMSAEMASAASPAGAPESWQQGGRFETVVLQTPPLGSTVNEAEEALFADDLDLELDIGGEEVSPLGTDGQLMFDVNIGPEEQGRGELPSAAPGAAGPTAATPPDLSVPLDFDIGEADSEQPAAETPRTAETTARVEDFIAWSTDGPDSPEDRPPPTETLIMDGWVAGNAGETMFDISPSEQEEHNEEAAGWAGEDSSELMAGDSWLDVEDEVATKLELARAYIDMESSDSALSVLREIMEEGNEFQRRDAEELMRGLEASV